MLGAGAAAAPLVPNRLSGIVGMYLVGADVRWQTYERKFTHYLPILCIAAKQLDSKPIGANGNIQWESFL